MKVKVLPSAWKDLTAIDDYLVAHFDFRVADEVAAEIFGAFELLADFPNMGHTRPDLMPASFRFFHLWLHWIVYRPSTPLLVHRVYHAKRDLRRLNLP